MSQSKSKQKSLYNICPLNCLGVNWSYEKTTKEA